MTSWISRVLFVVLCVLSSRFGEVSAFHSSKSSRETTPPATGARPPFQMNKAPHKPEVRAASAPAAAAHFGFTPAVQAGGYYEEEEEEVEISVGTAIVARAVSLALGFGLGYGT